MSLVYDALRQPVVDATAGVGLSLAAPRRGSQALAGYRRPALWLVCGMLVAGPAGYLLSRPAAPVAEAAVVADATLPGAGNVDAAAGSNAASTATPQPAPTDPAVIATLEPLASSQAGPAPQAPAYFVETAPVVQAASLAMPPASPAPAMTPAAQAAVAPAQAPLAQAPAAAPELSATIPAPASAAGGVPAAPAATLATAATSAPMPPAAAPPVVTSSAPPPARGDVQVVASQIQLSVHKREPSAARAASGEEGDAGAVRGAMAALNAAVGEHDTAATALAIAHLRTLLPAESLTLLRARAWAAHGTGDYPQAEELYRAILDRVPDDEHAGVNLALLDARRGEMADARARLDRMAARNARSPQIAQALAELDAGRP